MIPAGASLLMLFTILIMFYSALKIIFNDWTLIIIIIIVLGINAIANNFFFDYRNSAYGLDYQISTENNNIENKAYYNSLNFQEDYTKTIRILNNWKEKNTDPEHPEQLPKIVFINTSGGGMKAMIWTYLALAYSDSLLDGELFQHPIT